MTKTDKAQNSKVWNLIGMYRKVGYSIISKLFIINKGHVYEL